MISLNILMMQTEGISDIINLQSFNKPWRLEKFTDVVKDITGGNKKILTSEYLEAGLLPIIDQGEKMIGGYSNEIACVKRSKPIIVFGDHSKALKYVDFDFCLGADGVKVLEPVNDLDSKFLYYYLLMQKLPDVGYSRHFKFLKEIQVPLPPLPTQKRIAEILDKADALRNKDQQLLKYYDDLAQSLFIEMFGDPVKNEKGWEVKKLGTLIKNIRYGASAPPIYSNHGIPFVRATNIKRGEIVKKGLVFVSEEEAAKIKKCFIKESDLIIVRSGVNSGDCGYINKEYSGSLAGFDLIIEIDNPHSIFNHFILNTASFKPILESLSRRAGQPHLNSDQIKNLDVIFPLIDLQTHFALQVENILQQKEKLRAHIQSSENLFQVLLQKAFSGALN